MRKPTIYLVTYLPWRDTCDISAAIVCKWYGHGSICVKMASNSKPRQYKRIFCPHCNESVSKSTWYAHYAAFYDQRTKKWEAKNDNGGCVTLQMNACCITVATDRDELDPRIAYGSSKLVQVYYTAKNVSTVTNYPVALPQYLTESIAIHSVCTDVLNR